jgi:hypothetical protein
VELGVDLGLVDEGSGDTQHEIVPDLVGEEQGPRLSRELPSIGETRDLHVWILDVPNIYSPTWFQ